MLLLVVCVWAVCVSAGDDENILRLTDVPAAEAFLSAPEVAVVGFFQSEELSLVWCQEMSQNAVSSGLTLEAEEAGRLGRLWDCGIGIFSAPQTDTEAARGYEEFLAAVKQINSLPAAVCGEKEVWEKYGIASDTISIFRKADLHQEHLKLSEAKRVDVDGLTRFLTMNSLHYVTEYNQATAVGLFQSGVKTHLLLMADRGRSRSDPLQQIFQDLAPKYTGKMLFVLVNGGEKANGRVLEYFGVRSRDLPRIGIYDGVSDRKWLMPSTDITTEHVQDFCDSFLNGELQKQKEDTPEDKTEL